MNKPVGERERCKPQASDLKPCMHDWGAVVIFLAAALVVGTIVFGSCMAKIEAEGFHRRDAENAEKDRSSGKEAVGGCGVAAPGREHARPVVRGCHLAPVADRQRGMSEPGGESGQSPISLQAVAVPLVEGPREAPAGQPAVPPVGPGGRRFWRVTIHHTATSANNPAERVRAIDSDHRSRGWDGIGYHFLVAEDGTVFSGRPLDRQGAHVRGENDGNLGIALIGTYTDRAPPAAALASVRRLLAWAFETWGFGSEAVYFHRELAATECPGPWDKGVLY